MTETPKKTLSLNRKPTSTTTPSNTLSRGGKRIIRREDLNPAPAKPANPKGKPTNKKKPARKPTKKPTIAPSDLKAKELNDRLNAFPVWLNYQPLALGIEKQIFKLVNDEQFPGASKKVVQKVLRRHTQHGCYLQVLQKGGVRYWLDGVEDGEVTSQQQAHASEERSKRVFVNQNS